MFQEIVSKGNMLIVEKGIKKVRVTVDKPCRKLGWVI